MDLDEVERRLAAILSVDVVGYSRLMGADEAGTLAALKAHRKELLNPKTTQHNGRLVNTAGDGALLEFTSVVDAVHFAVDVQAAMLERNAAVPEEHRMQFRIGINIGDIIVDGDDIYGDGVNIAARLEAIAEPGGICIARNVFSQVKGKLDVTFEHLGEQHVKNIAEPIEVYCVPIDDAAIKLRTPVNRAPAKRLRRGRAEAAAAVLISYSTKDAVEFAARLRLELEKAGFSIWQDLVALEGARNWWSQIEGALKSKDLQHFLFVVTPGALASPVVRQEIRLARQEGKTICPIKGPGMPESISLPRWLGQIYDLDRTEHWTTLRRVLESESRQQRVPMMAPEPPAEFVERPKEFEALKIRLLQPDSKDAVAITAVLRGAGGYGKTTLAKALAHDPDIQDAYFDGVLWGELGEQSGGKVLALLSDLVTLITGEAPACSTMDAARAAFAEALGHRRMLLIVDDVWNKRDLEPFLQGGTNTTRLVTTRFNSELPADVVRQAVDRMQTKEALTLIEWGLPDDEVRANKPDLATLVDHLGEWALLLTLANGFLRDRVMKNNRSLEGAIADVNRRLAARGFSALDDRKAKDYAARHQSVAAMMRTSLDLLDEDKRQRFGELGIFPEDADIPLGIVERLWQETGGLDEIDTEDLLIECLDLSLLLSLDLDRRSLRFHDAVRHFVQDKAGKDGLIAQHRRLLRAIDNMGGAEIESATDRRYFFQYLPEHLAASGERGRLDELLLDPGWLKAKLDTTESPLTIVSDYDQHGVTEAHTLIGTTLRLITGICARDQRQLIPQLFGRLMASAPVINAGFVDRLRMELPSSSLITTRPSLTPPGAETARLEGHLESVNALAVLPDGRLASGSRDDTIRLWDLATGAETARLEGNGGEVSAFAVLPDERLASGSRDHTIRLWDLATGTETARLEGHGGAVDVLAVLPDGRLASGSWDGTIRLWDLSTGAEAARLEGIGGAVFALAVLPDGRLASGSIDQTIRLWDLDTGAETARIKGHGGAVEALAVLPDGCLASGSWDGTIRLWDLDSGAETARLEGNGGAVFALAVLPDGRLASGSDDPTIRLWDLSTGAETARIKGHRGTVNALTVLPGRRLASGSWDHTIRLWDLSTGAEAARLEGHGLQVDALAVVPGGRLASGSLDHTIRLWNLAAGAETARLEGHRGAVGALAVLPDGRLASGSSDKTIRLWDLATGAETARLEGHGSTVSALTVLPGGRLASGSWDQTIRLWDLAAGAQTARLEGHGLPVDALAVLPDGRLASGSRDDTIRLWDLATGAETARLEGHTDSVNALAVLSDCRLASGSGDDTIRLWDLATGAETARLEGHGGPVSALAVLPDGRLASGSGDDTIRLWDAIGGNEISRLEVDSEVSALAVGPDHQIIAGDSLGRLHWLEIVA